MKNGLFMCIKPHKAFFKLRPGPGLNNNGSLPRTKPEKKLLFSYLMPLDDGSCVWLDVDASTGR